MRIGELKSGFNELSARLSALATHLTDSVTMLTKEGFELRHEVFLHDAPTEPEEVSEDTTE